MSLLVAILFSGELKLETPAFNLVLHTSPFGEEVAEIYHWHVEILPRLTRVAGFEWGTGFYINPVPPEQAAEFLQGTDVDLTPRPKK